MSVNSDVPESLCEKLHSALLSLPTEDKEAYVEAMEKVPDLVRIEADPRRFLRCEKLDVTLAARRMSTYWVKRKQVFGSRFLLPIDCTGNGALNHEDIERYKDGGFAVFPKDNVGHPVICIDRARVKTKCMATQLRFIFFCVSQAALSDIAQTEGVVYLFHISEQTTNNSERRKVFIKLIGGAFPIVTHALHFAAAVPKGTKRMMNNTTVPNMMNDMGRNAHVHLCDSPEGVFAKLAPHGFIKERLPPTFGGTYTYEKFERWVSDMKAPQLIAASSRSVSAARLAQMQSENQDGPQTSLQLKVAALPPANVVKLSAPLKSGGRKRPPMMSGNQESPELKVVASESVFSTQKNGSQDSSLVQSIDNSLPTTLRSKRLSDDLDEDRSSKRARGEHTTDSDLDNDMDATEVEGKLSEIRKKNALYSKRKYYKKKERIHQLIQDRYHLDADNVKLKEEGKRLEALLVEAQKQVTLHESQMPLSVPSVPGALAGGISGPSSLVARDLVAEMRPSFPQGADAFNNYPLSAEGGLYARQNFGPSLQSLQETLLLRDMGLPLGSDSALGLYHTQQQQLSAVNQLLNPAQRTLLQTQNLSPPSNELLRAPPAAEFADAQAQGALLEYLMRHRQNR